MTKGGLNDIEHSAFDVILNAGEKPDGGAVDYCVVSIAISLKRIADALTTTDFKGQPFSLADLVMVIADRTPS
jgi:hypothetical protein